VPKRYDNVFKQITKFRCKTLVEVGVWNGVTAEKMIKSASVQFPFHMINYYGFDLFEDFNEFKKEHCPKRPVPYTHVKARLDKLGAKIHLFQGRTDVTLAEFVPEKKIDFIFIDGGHSEETILSDWENLQKVITEKTIIIFDDYYHNKSGVGCRFLIENLSCEYWKVTMLHPTEVFKGLQISMIKVVRTNTPLPDEDDL